VAIHTFVAGEAFTAAQANFINTGADTGTYTPTLTGMAIGTGGTPLNTASFCYIGGVLVVEGNIQFGTSGQTFPTAPTLTLPSGYTMTTFFSARPIGNATFNDSGSGGFAGRVFAATSSTVAFNAENAAGTHSSLVALSTTVPYTWASNDGIYYEFVVRATAA